ncbi:hypothetical protein pb186bvf_018512 [Paramecium bursaria]
MGACHSQNPVIIYDPEFSKYTQLLMSIKIKHLQFDFRILQILSKKDDNIFFKVKQYLSIDVEMVLKKMQLSIEMTDGFLLKYYTSFASRNGNFVFIVYEYVVLISLERLLLDENQEQRMLINQETQSQLFGIFYLLNKFQLSIHNLAIQNIFIYQKQGKIYIKLINITLIQKYEYMVNSTLWKLEQCEIKALIEILKQLNSKNIENIHKTQQLDAILNDLENEKYELKAAVDNYNVYKKWQKKKRKILICFYFN